MKNLLKTIKDFFHIHEWVYEQNFKVRTCKSCDATEVFLFPLMAEYPYLRPENFLKPGWYKIK